MNSFFVVFFDAFEMSEIRDFLIEYFEESPFHFIGECFIGEDEVGISCSSHFLQEEISFGEYLL